ncbi:MAG: hypothetical protein U0165_17035 [Polyangiaceae bacterium]
MRLKELEAMKEIAEKIQNLTIVTGSAKELPLLGSPLVGTNK